MIQVCWIESFGSGKKLFAVFVFRMSKQLGQSIEKFLQEAHKVIFSDHGDFGSLDSNISQNMIRPFDASFLKIQWYLIAF